MHNLWHGDAVISLCSLSLSIFFFPRYTIYLSHGEFKWTIRRRYKHFLKLDAELFFHKVKVKRRSLRGNQHYQHLPRRHLPKRPDMFATQQHMEHRIKALERYLQVILDNKQYLNHRETLNFLEVSQFSFRHELGDKGR